MNRIDTTLAQLNAEGKKMLSPYITAGDPTPELTVTLMHELVRSGANILELGIPFSDPMAEGPVIQHAMERALAHSVRCKDVLKMVSEFRKKDNKTPVVIMGYLNPIEQYGYDSFAKNAIAAGVDGTILVDLPPEESQSISAIWKSHGLYSIFLCSPTTSEDRLALISRQAQGYLYYVSLKGVTGANALDIDTLKAQYNRIKSQVDLPLMVGFGIKTAQMASDVALFADGVIVGAALITQIIDAYKANTNCLDAAHTLLSAMRTAMDTYGT